MTREYRSEFRPKHGVWVLKRVERDVQDAVPGEEAVRLHPSPLANAVAAPAAGKASPKVARS